MRVVALLTALFPATAFAGAWTQSEGGAFLKAGSRFVQADEFYDPEGTPTDTATLTDALFSLYAEYGLLEDLTLIGDLPVRRLVANRLVGELSGAVSSEGETLTALGDARLAARYRLGRLGQTVFSLQGAVGIPLGRTGADNRDANQAAREAGLPDEEERVLVTGDGEADLGAELLVGHSFGSVYVTSNLGFTKRFEGFSDEFRYGAEAGWSPGWGTVLLRLNGLQSLKNGEGAPDADGSLFADKASFLAVGPEVTVNVIDSIGVSAAVETVLFGENVFRAPAFTLGLVYSR
ncbi:MAG: hypothetical protein AAFU77_05815 [Myxococcota bacterium]